MSNLEALRNELSLSLATREAGDEFNKLQACHQELVDFLHFSDVVSFLHDPSEDYDLKDAVLLSMICSYQQGHNSEFLTCSLLLTMWPALMQIISERAKKKFYYEDLFSDVQDAFFQALTKYPVKRRPRKVALNLKMETLRELCGHFQELNLQREAENEYQEMYQDILVLFSEELLHPPVPARQDMAQFEWNESNIETARTLLGTLVTKSVITSDESELIFNTRVLRRPLSKYASGIGADYEALKKRRQRAENCAVSFLKNIFLPNLSHLPENRTVHLREPESPKNDSQSTQTLSEQGRR